MVMMKKGGLSSSMNAKLIGSGPEVVVLAHGYGGDQSFWDKVVPCLAQTHQVLVFDWNFSWAFNKITHTPNNNHKIEKNNDNHEEEDDHDHDQDQEGFCEFDPIKYNSFEAFADDLVCLIEEMGIKSCTFVGHSMSGMVGCFASLKRPQLFNKLILIGASPRYINSEDYEGGFEMPEIEQLLSTMEANFHAWASAFAPLAMASKDDPLLVEKFERSLQKMKPKVALAVAKLIFLGDNRQVLEHVNTPCTIIATHEDLVVPSSVPYYMQRKMIRAKSDVEFVDVQGHFPHLTAHDQLLEVLGRALS